MNDNELTTAVRESVTGVHATTPVSQIISRGRAVHARRRIPGVAGAMAVAAGVALAVVTLAPSSHPANRQPTAQLAAWTVAKQADGDIYVTINELRDPAGLQRTLRADGLPVNVSFTGPPLSAACQSYPASSKDLLTTVFQFHPGERSAILVIHPSALPSGVGVSIFDRPGLQSPPQAKGLFPLAVSLVQASQQCTGS